MTVFHCIILIGSKDVDDVTDGDIKTSKQPI